MRKKTVNSQLNNFKTYLMYLRQCRALAENVFKLDKVPEFVDISYINKILVDNGSIAWFKDDILGVIALPWVRQGNLDVYGRPTTIRVQGSNGYTRVLNPDEYVIMYDNYGRYPLLLDICQYAERLALETRTIDINIAQQKSPRIWTTNQNKLKSVEDILNNIDSCENTVIAYENLNVDKVQAVLDPAPFVTDKLDIHKQNTWNEFLRLIGVANLNVQKKERNIRDEIMTSQGGTIASRYNRFEPRKKAIELINQKWGLNIEVSYYDNLPTTLQESEVIDYDTTMDSDID